MECLKNGTCHRIETSSWDSLSDSLVLGTSFSIFITTVEVFLSVIFIFSIPSIRKDSSFLYLCIFMAPFLVSTFTKAFFLILETLQMDLSKYYVKISTILSNCYDYFVIFSMYGIIVHSLICLKIHMSKKLPSKIVRRLLYLVIFCGCIAIHVLPTSSEIAQYLFWTRIGGLSLAAGLSFLIFLFSSGKYVQTSNREIKNSRSRIFWNILCVVASCQEFLEFWIAENYKINHISSLTNIFENLGGVVYVSLIFILLPVMRNTIFHCCYPSEITEQDRIFLLTRSNSDRGSISTISSSSVVPLPPTRIIVTSTLPTVQ